jgi:lipoprotein NlpI
MAKDMTRFLISILVIIVVHLSILSSAKKTGVLHKIGALGIALATVLPTQSVLALPTAEDYVSTGVKEFKRGHVRQSVWAFDKAIELKKGLEPYLWQRGLALYFENRFEECERWLY